MEELVVSYPVRPRVLSMMTPIFSFVQVVRVLTRVSRGSLVIQAMK